MKSFVTAQCKNRKSVYIYDIYDISATMVIGKELYIVNSENKGFIFSFNCEKDATEAADEIDASLFVDTKDGAAIFPDDFRLYEKYQ